MLVGYMRVSSPMDRRLPTRNGTPYSKPASVRPSCMRTLLQVRRMTVPVWPPA
jgi:hypothetical protein